MRNHDLHSALEKNDIESKLKSIILATKDIDRSARLELFFLKFQCNRTYDTYDERRFVEAVSSFPRRGLLDKGALLPKARLGYKSAAALAQVTQPLLPLRVCVSKHLWWGL